MRHFRHDNPMESPLGHKLREQGYTTFWAYLDQNGFVDLDAFRHAISFCSLIPAGFYDFLLACAGMDNRWRDAFCVAAADFLNNARSRYRDDRPDLGSNWIVVQPVSKLASVFGDEIAWASQLTFDMRDHLLENRHLFDTPFSYDDEWLVDLVNQAATP